MLVWGVISPLPASSSEKMLELHRGQGKDIYWRDSYTCPTEEEYIMMVKESKWSCDVTWHWKSCDGHMITMVTWHWWSCDICRTSHAYVHSLTSVWYLCGYCVLSYDPVLCVWRHYSPALCAKDLTHLITSLSLCGCLFRDGRVICSGGGADATLQWQPGVS